jgi:lysine 2,3-aminomutase
MEKWKKIHSKSLKSIDAIAQKFEINKESLHGLEKQFNIKITPHYLSLIKEKGDAIYKQVIPDKMELLDDGEVDDPLDEDNNSPVPSIVHRYPDRCLFLVAHSCASYCRFCTRKRKVGDPQKISKKYIEEGLRYIAARPEIRDVIISGGDPLMMGEQEIDFILGSLRAIPHLEILRIGTRVPCFLPQRITMKLVKVLKKYHPLFINVHFNHPDELSPEAVKALGRLADAGIPLGNQTVLLAGVNDDPIIMKKLMHKLLLARVRPYYIYQADMVFGTAHFRTSVQKGIEIIENLRGWTSGLGVPHFVIDAPGGGGKIPLMPEYVLKMSDDEVVLRNYQGKIFRYSQSTLKNDEYQVEVSEAHMPFINTLLNE